jgi:hypothetical protein
MHLPSIISLLGLIITSSPVFVEAKCFSQGLLLSDLRGGLYNHTVDDAINDYCEKYPSFPGYGHMTYECYTFDNSQDPSSAAKLEMSVRNFLKIKKVRVLKSDCLATFRREVGGCPHGSAHFLGFNWHISIDPNMGPCGERDDTS